MRAHRSCAHFLRTSAAAPLSAGTRIRTSRQEQLSESAAVTSTARSIPSGPETATVFAAGPACPASLRISLTSCLPPLISSPFYQLYRPLGRLFLFHFVLRAVKREDR